MRRISRAMLVAAVGVLVACVAVFAPVNFAGDALVATVDEPFVVAGAKYPGGRVRVRVVGSFTPRVALTEVWVGEHCLGVLRAERVEDAEPAMIDALSFERRADRSLVLVGFASPRQDVNGQFRFEDTRSSGPTIASNHVGSPYLLSVADRLGHVGVGGAALSVTAVETIASP